MKRKRHFYTKNVTKKKKLQKVCKNVHISVNYITVKRLIFLNVLCKSLIKFKINHSIMKCDLMSIYKKLCRPDQSEVELDQFEVTWRFYSISDHVTPCKSMQLFSKETHFELVTMKWGQWFKYRFVSSCLHELADKNTWSLKRSQEPEERGTIFRRGRKHSRLTFQRA